MNFIVIGPNGGWALSAVLKHSFNLHGHDSHRCEGTFRALIETLCKSISISHVIMMEYNFAWSPLNKAPLKIKHAISYLSFIYCRSVFVPGFIIWSWIRLLEPQPGRIFFLHPQKTIINYEDVECERVGWRLRLYLWRWADERLISWLYLNEGGLRSEAPEEVKLCLDHGTLGLQRDVLRK